MAADDRTGRANRAEAGDVRAAVLATLAVIAPETDLKAIAPDRPLRDQVELDSIDWLNVIVGLCERLSIDIPESDYGRLASLDSIVDYVAARQAGRDRAQVRAAPTAAGAELPCTRHRVRGTAVTVRPMRAGDAALETAFVERLSHESRYERFMTTVRELPQSKLRHLTDVDQVRHVALVATADRDGREAMIGVVRYVVDNVGTGCEFAIVIEDDWKGSGLAGILMLALMNVARGRGLKTMEGSVLAVNSAMLKFMRQLGFTQEREPGDAQTVRVVRAL